MQGMQRLLMLRRRRLGWCNDPKHQDLGPQVCEQTPTANSNTVSHRLEEGVSPTRLFTTPDGQQWVKVPVQQPAQQQLFPQPLLTQQQPMMMQVPLLAQQPLLAQVPLTQPAQQQPPTQPPAGGLPRTPVFARNRVVADVSGRGRGGAWTRAWAWTRTWSWTRLK